MAIRPASISRVFEQQGSCGTRYLQLLHALPGQADYERVQLLAAERGVRLCIVDDAQPITIARVETAYVPSPLKPVVGDHRRRAAR